MNHALEYLKFHWSDAYDIRKVPSGEYIAVAKFGKQEKLTAYDPDRLLNLIRRHYPGHRESSST
jgi:hypothetical protein